MQRIAKIQYSIFLLTFLFLSSCRYDKAETDITPDTGYPPEVDAIITKKCATSGCHNSINPSANLDFTTMDQMLKGNSTGAVIIPFRPDQSTLLFFTNTDSLSGPILSPTMPVNESPLSNSEYLTLKNWIAAGAPNKNGIVPFSGNPNRRKFYVVNQACDLLSVFDADSRVIMRYKDLGTRPGLLDSPHNIKITPDGKYVLIPFLAQNLVQVFSTETDELITNISIPVPGNDSGAWNTIVVSSDSKWAYSVDNAQGRIAYIDLLSKTASVISTNTPQLHGIALNETNDTLFVVENLGYKLWVIPVNSPGDYDTRDLRNNTTVSGATTGTGNLNMHEIVFSPDFSTYFITSESTSKVFAYMRTGNPNHDSLVAVFNVPSLPQEIAFSKTTDYVFITCMSATTFPDVMGAVEVINYKTMQRVTTLKAGWEPHGIAVDDNKGLVYVINRNADNGIPSHHSTDCGQNGWLTTFDLHTLLKLPGNPELSGDPYQVAIRP